MPPGWPRRPVSERSYNIIGTGALGGYYGARLACAGLDVRFLLHSDYEQVRARGLRVESPEGDFSVAQPVIYSSAENMEPADVALVALKTTSNESLPALLPPAVREGGAVLVMQNGLFMEDLAARACPGREVLGGMAFLCSNKLGPGHIRHLDYGAVRLGQWTADGRAAGVTGLVENVAADFERAGLQVSTEEDLLLGRWKKLVWNITYNGLCVLHDCTTDVLMGDPSLRERCRGIMLEVVRAAAACGREIKEEFVEIMLRDTEAMAAYSPSMLLDYRAGRPLEIEAIYGNPLRAAEEAGADCPLIRDAYQGLQAVAPHARKGQQ